MATSSRVAGREECDPESELDSLDSKEYALLYPDVASPEPVVSVARCNTHSAESVKIIQNRISNATGYRMAKSSHGVITGHWYLEVAIEPHQGTTRIGWSQISGHLQCPTGFDAFSYAFRSMPMGGIFHKGIGYRFGAYREGYGPGDVLGLEIFLPALSAEQEAVLKARQYVPGRNYQQFRVQKPLPVLKGSYVRYYRNGNDLGIAFRDLLLGRYYPAFSAFRGGKMVVNFSPSQIPPNGARPYSAVLHDPSNAFWDVDPVGKASQYLARAEKQTFCRSRRTFPTGVQ